MPGIILPTYLKGLPTTKVTTSEDSGDDGDYEVGVINNSNDRFSAEFTRDSGKMVYDTVTGLTWPTDLDAADAVGIAAGSVVADYAAALTIVSTANSNAFGGYADWRLPNIFELFTLTDFETSAGSSYTIDANSGIELETAGGAKSNRSLYWSSTPFGPTNHFVMQWRADPAAFCCAIGDTTSNAYAICVRGGKVND